MLRASTSRYVIHGKIKSKIYVLVFEWGAYNSQTQCSESERSDAVGVPWNNICINYISFVPHVTIYLIMNGQSEIYHWCCQLWGILHEVVGNLYIMSGKRESVLYYNSWTDGNSKELSQLYLNCVVRVTYIGLKLLMDCARTRLYWCRGKILLHLQC